MNFIYYVTLLILSIFFILTDHRQKTLEFHFSKAILIKRNYFTLRELMLLIICLSLIALCGTRPVRGTYDTSVYVDYFKQILSSPFFKINGRFRPGFEFLSKSLLLVYSTNYGLCFATFVLINCIVVWKAIKNLGQGNAISFIIYIGFIGLYYNYIVIRSGMAISFVFLAYSYLGKSNRKVLVSMIIAVLLHETSLIVFLALLAIKYLYPLKRRTAFIILGIATVLYFTRITDMLVSAVMNWLYPYLPSSWFHTYILYLDSQNYSNRYSLYYIICFALSGIAIYYMGKKDNIYKKFVIINVTGQLIFSLFSSNDIMGRMWDYMVPVTFLYMLPNVFHNGWKRTVFCLLVFLMTFLLRTKIIILRLPFYI